MAGPEAEIVSLLDRLTAGGDPIYERRNARARARGWSSYGQMRYWLPRFGVRPDGSVDKELQAETAIRLGRRICPDHPRAGNRTGSYLCKACDLLVNGDGRNPAPGRHRGSGWRARLVNGTNA